MRKTCYCFYYKELLALFWPNNERDKRGFDGCSLTATAKRHLRECSLGGKEAISLLVEKEEDDAKKKILYKKNCKEIRQY